MRCAFFRRFVEAWVAGATHPVTEGMRLMLLRRGYGFDQAHCDVSDVRPYEVEAGWYESGGRPVPDVRADGCVVRAGPVEWPQPIVGARSAVLCVSSGLLVAWFELDPKDTDHGVEWPSGVLFDVRG